MASPKPKMLSALTVPDGGWQLRIKVSVAGSFDTTVDATMAAGDYFMAGDQQADDFLYELMIKVNVAIDASGFTLAATDGLLAWIDSDHKVNLGFDGGSFEGATIRDVEITWTALDGSSIAGVLGFGSSADDQSTGVDFPVFVGDYHHAYGWYADEDGYLAGDLAVDSEDVTVPRSLSPAGFAKIHFVAGRFSNQIQLQFLKDTEMNSDGKGYADVPLHPYDRNRGLECWWYEASRGVRFRYYRDGRHDTISAADRGTSTAGTTTTLTDSGKNHSVEPFRWPGRLIRKTIGDVLADIHWHIASHTATVLTVTNALWQSTTFGTEAYFLLDQPYRTYWLDTEQMRKFLPSEVPRLNRYNISIPVMKYKA